nr:MAG TPA: protein of unknown function (DUF4518) [Caudoviricetes sp.]DAP26324.1 MAG TPA: protein of unknown function (DUF4518) [Caudoviricetes sp.]DAY35919.1 MAG TPA: protein of unknown function (DUF4518) [Caudoviricetes sp.]
MTFALVCGTIHKNHRQGCIVHRKGVTYEKV